MRLIIIGDGPEKGRLVNLVQELGITDHVEWKQNLSKLELFSEYSKARIFVSLSSLESFSRVVHEAQIVGVPILASNEGISADSLNKERVIGIKTIEPEEISAAISKAISMGPDLSNASNSVGPDITQYADEMAEIYRKLVAS